jgi:hypothetical protein
VDRGAYSPEYLLSEGFIETADYQRAEPGPSVVDVTIKFAMPYRWRDAAAALGLDEAEYVRRRLIMTETMLAPFDGVYCHVQPGITKIED